MRVLSFFLLAAPAVAFLAPVPSKPSSMALQAQRNNEVRREGRMPGVTCRSCGWGPKERTSVEARVHAHPHTCAYILHSSPSNDRSLAART